MKVLTLHQPWATLIAIGAKWIETRPARTHVRGRVAIHAAATTASIDLLPGDCEGNMEEGWRYGYLGDFQVGYRSAGGRRDTFISGLERPFDGELPLGAIVATADLFDCVPIYDLERSRAAVLAHADHVWADHVSLAIYRWLDVHGSWSHHGDQRPYGDFTDGRWAWLLRDVIPLEQPIPFRGGQGWSRFWEPSA